MPDSILIVDDERGIRETLRGVMEDEGFVADAVATGEECLKSIERRAYGCVLLDVWLPGIDGLETLKQLRAAGSDAAVVIISGHGTVETAVRATKLGAFDFIEKPLSIEKTVLVVRNALRQQQLELILDGGWIGGDARLAATDFRGGADGWAHLDLWRIGHRERTSGASVARSIAACRGAFH